MLAPALVDVTVRVDNVPRKLFTVIERNSGDVLITFRSSEYFYDRTAKSSLLPAESVFEQRYSIHQSSQSSEKISTIKHTLRTSARTLRSYQMTRAIKDGSGFTLLFSRFAPYLGRERFSLLKPSKENLDLGSYDPNKDSFGYSVFVGSSSADFGPSKVHGPIAGVVCRNIQLIILYSRFRIPSSEFGYSFHYATLAPELAESEEERKNCEIAMTEMQPAVCVGVHNWIMFELLERHIDTIEQLLPEKRAEVTHLREQVRQQRRMAGVTD